MSFFQVALAVSVTLAAFASGSTRAQTSGSNERNQAFWDKIEVRPLDGPYSYKSPDDLIAIVGYVTEDKGPDGVVFRDCDGHIKTVKRTELKRIQRNCRSQPDGPWGVWVRAEGGKIAPVVGFTKDSKVYLGLEKVQIDLHNLPAEYKEQVEAAKPGDWVALSYPSNGKLNLSILPNPVAVIVPQ